MHKIAGISKFYFLSAALEGLAFLVYLLSFPSDSDARVLLGFSWARLSILAIMLLGTLLFGGLTLLAYRKPGWAPRLAERLLVRPTILPLALLILSLSLMGIVGWVGLFKHEWLLSIGPAHLTRLAPLGVWLLLLIAKPVAAWAWLWGQRPSLSNTRLDLAALLVLFLLSGYARLSMTGYGLPYQTIWDEVVTYPQAMRMLITPGLKPVSDVPGYGANSYGDLLVYVTAGGEVLGLMNGFRTQQINSIEEYVSPPQGVNSIYSAVHPSGIPLQYPRMLIGLINSLAPLAIYLMLRRYFHADQAVAFAGAFIFAFLSRDVIYYSSYILPDALATTLFTFLLLAGFECIRDEEDRLAPYAVCGVLAGMILSVTIRLAAVAGLPFLAFLFARKKTRPVEKLLVAGAGLFIGFVLTSPYALLDLPSQLAKWTSFSWYHELGGSHRLESLLYYFQGAFMPGFSSTYVDSSAGSIGLGLLAGALALLGLGRLVWKYPRSAAWMGIFFILHLYTISPIVQRYTRHALVLYPMVCLASGVGLVVLRDGLRELGCRLETHHDNSWGDLLRRRHQAWYGSVPLFLLAIFLLASGAQMRHTVSYMARSKRFEPVQVQAARYLLNQVQPGQSLGILAPLPFIETSLLDQEIEIVRLPLHSTWHDLQGSGVDFVLATDRFGGNYSDFQGSLWETRFAGPGAKLAEFGYASLQFEGYPASNLYMFVSSLKDSP